MKQLVLFGIFLWFMSFIELCSIRKNVMDCTGLNLTDCPSVNKSFTILILNDNLLRNMSTPNCISWSQLDSLLLRHNRLQTIPQLNVKNLDLSQNELINISISFVTLKFIDLSENPIKNLKIFSPNLEKLNLRNASIDTFSLNGLIQSLHSAHLIRSLDFSNNIIGSIPIQFMTFSINGPISISFSGNRFSTVDFSDFLKNQYQIYNFNFSFNEISKISLGHKLSVKQLDLSNNQLANVDGDNLSNFQYLELIDFSHNPLNCLCNESRSFIDWMKDNSHIVVNQNQTLCKIPPKQSIFKIKCETLTTTATTIHSSTSGTTGISSTTTKHATTSNPIITTKSIPSTTNSNIRQELAISLVSIFLFILIGAFCFIVYKYWRRQVYTEFGRFNEYCCPFICRDGLNRYNHPPDSFGSFEAIDSEGSLLIICSSKDTKWIRKKIISNIQIRHQIVDSKIRHWPVSDFTLIVVTGAACLKDYRFVNNVEKALQLKDNSETRLLVKKFPEFDTVLIDNPLTEYLRDIMGDRFYFQYDETDQETCLDSMRLWLNLDA